MKATVNLFATALAVAAINLAAAEAKANEYEQRLRESRLSVFKAQEARRQAALAASIPARSVLLLVDDRHAKEYYDTLFRQYWQQWGWPVVNAWISTPLNTQDLWAQQEALNAEERGRALRLLEMQHQAMLMYTSCAWFFSDVSGIGYEVSYSDYRNGNERVNTVRHVPNTFKNDEITLMRLEEEASREFKPFTPSEAASMRLMPNGLCIQGAPAQVHDTMTGAVVDALIQRNKKELK